MKQAAFLVLFFVVAARADDVERCRRLFVHVVLNRAAMMAGDLSDFAAAPLGTSPSLFSKFPDEVSRHTFSRAFAALLEGPEGKAVAKALRAEALRLAGKKGDEEKARTQAQDRTHALPAPRLVRTLDRYSPRPVIFENGGRRYAAFGSDRGLAVLDLGKLSMRDIETDAWPISTAPHFFTHGGHGWLASVGNARGYGGVPGIEVHRLDGKQGSLVDNDSRPADAGPLPLIVDGKLWLATTEGLSDTALLVPVAQPGEKIRAFPGVADKRNPVLQTDGHRVLSRREDGAYVVIHPNGGTVPVKVQDANYMALHGGRIFVAGHAGAYTLDLSGKDRRPLPFRRPIETGARLAGNLALVTTLVHSTGPREIHVIDLDTGTTRFAARTPYHVYGLNHFRHDGRDYLTWAEDDGVVAVADLATPGLVVRKKILGDVRPNDIVPYPVENGVNAFVAADPASVVQLIGAK